MTVWFLVMAYLMASIHYIGLQTQFSANESFAPWKQINCYVHPVKCLREGWSPHLHECDIAGLRMLFMVNILSY